MNYLDVMQSCEICYENSMNRGVEFKVCDKCSHALDKLKAATDITVWDAPWFQIDYIEPKNPTKQVKVNKKVA